MTDQPPPEPPSEHPVRWGLGDVVVGLLPFLLSAIALLGADDDGDADPTLAGLVVSSVTLWLFLVGVPIVATRLKGRGPVADLGLRFRPADAWAFVLGVALQAIGVRALYWPLLRFTDLDTDDVSDAARDVVDSASGPGMILLVLVVCVGAPVAEELFFRGLTLRALDKRWGAGVALVGSTLIFAVSHFQGVQLPALVLFGAAAGVLALRTGRLGTAILCHAGFNAWTVFELSVFG